MPPNEKPADIIIDPDGSVWVSIHPTAPGLCTSYVEIEELQREGFDFARGAGARSGRPSQGYSRYSGGYIFSKPDFPARDDGIRDHRTIDDLYAEQARLYSQMYADRKEETYKKWFGQA